MEPKSDTPVVVPPDKAPLRQQGDLLGTLARLRQAYGMFSVAVDADAMTEGMKHRDSRLIGQLIATAVQQAEALPKPEGDLAEWQAEMGSLIKTAAFFLGDDRRAEVILKLCDMEDHLAAIPAQPDPNAGLRAALVTLVEGIEDALARLRRGELVGALGHIDLDSARDAIAAAEPPS